MSNSFIKLLVSQLFANLADIFFRVTFITILFSSNAQMFLFFPL